MLSIVVCHGLLWVAVDLLQVLWETGCWGGHRVWWQQIPLLQQVDHSQGLWGAGLEAQGCQGLAQLGWSWATRWLREGKPTSSLVDLFTKNLRKPNHKAWMTTHALIDWCRYLLIFTASKSDPFKAKTSQRFNISLAFFILSWEIAEHIVLQPVRMS